MRPSIPWKRLSAEGGIIVISILLAFWVDASWDAHQESKRRSVLMDDLREEIAQNRARLASLLERQGTRQAQIERLLNELTPAAAGLGEPALLALQDSILASPTFDPAWGVLELLIQSGDLTLIENRELRSGLAQLPAVSNDYLLNQHSTDPIFLELHLRAGSIMFDHSPYLGDRRVLTGAEPEDREYAVKALNTVRIVQEVSIPQGEALLVELDRLLHLMDDALR